MKKSILFIVLITCSISFSKSIVVKGEYSKGYDKPFSLNWQITSLKTKNIVIKLHDKLKGKIIFDSNGKIIKIIKYLTYQGKVKEFILTNKKSIEYEIKNSLIPFSFALDLFNNKQNKSISMTMTTTTTKHSFTIISELNL